MSRGRSTRASSMSSSAALSRKFRRSAGHHVKRHPLSATHTGREQSAAQGTLLEAFSGSPIPLGLRKWRRRRNTLVFLFLLQRFFLLFQLGQGWAVILYPVLQALHHWRVLAIQLRHLGYGFPCYLLYLVSKLRREGRRLGYVRYDK